MFKTKEVRKPKVEPKYREEIRDVLVRATLAWDVSPKGTREEGVIDKLVEELFEKIIRI